MRGEQMFALSGDEWLCFFLISDAHRGVGGMDRWTHGKVAVTQLRLSCQIRRMRVGGSDSSRWGFCNK